MDSMQRVLSYFREICCIPRRSGDESNVAQYLIETGKRLGLGVDQDSCGNVVLRKTISQTTPPTILQAHMDMVWESTGTPYQKGVSLRETDECLHAVGSTLGADNGIGMALILALMEDDTVQNIEGLFTVDEETGMTGAKELDASLVSGTRLINLDSETEGTFTISAAGGLNIILNASVECHKQSRFQNPKVLKLSVSGLKGGHSGLDIGTPHLNAIQILVRWLRSCPASNWELLELHGGTRSNAIPVCAEALIQVGDTSSEEEWKLAASAITAQAESVDHGILLQTSFEAPICKQAYTDSFCDQLLSTLAALPHGVLQRTPEIIQLSSNLATVRQLGDNVEIVESLRASSQALLSEGRDLVVHTADRASFQSSQQDYYPPWESAKDVPLHALFAQTYQSLFQQPCIMENVHAGVECSILQERCPFIQEMISIGPTIRYAHTVQENVNLSSIDRVYQLLKAVLRQLSN